MLLRLLAPALTALLALVLPAAARAQEKAPAPAAPTPAAPVAPAPAPVAPAPSAPAKGPEAASRLHLGVHEKVLSNGLTVLTVERPRAPRATCWLFMKTGSVNERPGITGISHLFEHLMFKGTKKIGVKDFALDQRLAKELDAAWKALQAAPEGTARDAAQKRFDDLRVEERKNDIQDELWDLYLANGGTGLNAYTSEDMTVYVVTLPSNRVELFCWLEADRLANAVFREFYPERDVVKEERRLDENRPDGPYYEDLNSLFFMAHPYQIPVVGWMSDLDAITPEDCRKYFDVFYAPNNAVMVVVGAVQAKEVEALAERYLGPIPRGKEPPPPVRTKEPPPAGERRLTVRRDQARARATVLFHCPQMGHPDGAALSVAQEILAGKSGRLYERLVEKDEAAIEVSAHHDEKRWAGSFSLEGYPRGDVPPLRLAELMQAEVDRLGKEPITEAELDRARNRLEAALLRRLEEPEALTELVGSMAVIADWRLIEELPARYRAVTAADVQRVVKSYLRKEIRTLGLLDAPETAGGDTPPAPAEPQEAPGSESPKPPEPSKASGEPLAPAGGNHGK